MPLLLLAPAARAFEAGAAKIEITPPVGTPMHGYGARMGRPSTAVHDPLWSRALYLSDGETSLFLVNTDLCFIPRELRERVLQIAPDAVPREHIILTATHTHSAHGAMNRHLPVRFVAGDFMPEVLEATAQKIAQSMRDAFDAKKRAAIGYTTAEQDVLSSNRRVKNGPIDKQIGIIRVDDADGNSLALVANFAAHPTSVPEEDNFAFSADYCGYYYETVEALSSPGCVGLFLNGAEGNQTIGSPEGKGGWERTESVGRLLAVRVKGAANKLACGEAKLRVAYAEPALPPTIASGFMPPATVLHSLEINDLLLQFVPGEPVVEIGLELRRRALAQGYAAQFTAGLANDYLMYFVPRRFYGQDTYETAQNYYGPGIEQWLYDEFGRMMSRPIPPPAPQPVPDAEGESIAGGLRVIVRGSGRAIGEQLGRVAAASAAAHYETRVTGAVRSGAWAPPGSAWPLWPPFLDPASLGIPLLAVAARPLLAGIDDFAFDAIDGYAAAAGLPFDAVWLLQHAVAYSERADKTALYDAPLCTMFAVLPPASGGGLLVGRNLDWPLAESNVLLEVHPEGGRSYLSAGFDWNLGVFTGMNDAGLTVAAERIKGLGDPPMTGPPVEFALRAALAEDATVDAAVARLQALTHLRGYHVLVAGPGAAGPDAAVVEFGEPIAVRRAASDGLLLGAEPGNPRIDPDTAARYARIEVLLAGGAANAARIEAALADREPGRKGRARILNEATRHSAIFDPAARRARVAFAGEDGRLGPYNPIALGGAAQP